MAGDDNIDVTEDGIETTFQTNYLGHFLLVGMLLKKLASSSRILLVSSELHRNDGPMKSFRPNYTKAEYLAKPTKSHIKGFGKMQYATSKLCLLLYMHKLAPALSKRNITMNAFNPGLMPDTGLGGLNRKLFRKLFLKYVLCSQKMPLAALRNRARCSREC